MSVDENITLEAWKASPLAIITVGRDWRIRFINPAGLRILARDEATLVDLPLPDLPPPEVSGPIPPIRPALSKRSIG